MITISTEKRESESVSVLGLKNDVTVFFSDDYRDDIVLKDSLLAFDEIKEDESLPKSSSANVNPFLFKTPIDLVFTVAKPEREFVRRLTMKENAEKISSW